MIEGKDTEYYLNEKDLLDTLKEAKEYIHYLENSRGFWRFLAIANLVMLFICLVLEI